MEKKKENNIESKKRKKAAIILGVLAALLFLGIIVLAPTLGKDVVNSRPSLPGLDRSVTSGEKIDRSDSSDDTLVKEEQLQQEVMDNTLNARIASALQPDDEGVMFLSLKNKYEDKLMQVTIVDTESEEVYYTSPVLEPSKELDYDRLTNELAKGQYECIAYFYYYTLEEEPISQVGAKIKLVIE